MSDNVLDDWVNPIYLNSRTVEDIRESVFAKPVAKYAVLDSFFNESKLEELIAHHKDLSFSEEQDRRSPKTGEWLPYDGAVCFARRGVHFGSDLFFDQEWHEYLAYLVHAQITHPSPTEIKLRYHRPDADGFWIHTDSGIRQLVAICYFNKDWKVSDGGLLQLWRVDEASMPNTPTVNNPKGRLEVLTTHQRIKTNSPGGGFKDKQSRDMILIDQIVPTYNRLFICNFQLNPAYHSVTPSTGRERTGFVQWLNGRKRDD